MAGQLQSKQDLELIKSNTMYKDIAQNLDIFKIELVFSRSVSNHSSGIGYFFDEQLDFGKYDRKL